MTEDLQKKCDTFNTLYPVGTEVLLLKDNGDVLETATRSPAQVLSGHSAVVWLENVTGCYLLERVRPNPNARRPRGVTTEEITKAYRAWLASFERGRTIDVEQAFAAGYRAASVPPIIREAFAAEKAKEDAEHAAVKLPEADRLPYDLRLAIGKALDRCVCDDSTPEQVDAFIAVFAEFGLFIVATTSNTWKARTAGKELGERQMWQRVRDIVDERLMAYLVKEAASNPCAVETSNEHEKYRHTREAMERLAELLRAIAPKKTLNFETGIAPAEARGPDNAS